MTKAREIAELGQKLTVDGSGNLDIAGTVEANNIQVEGATGGLINVYRSSANANFDAITFKDTTNTNINGKIGWNANELRLEGTNTARITAGGSDKFFANSSGVGINTSAVDNPLEVYTSANDKGIVLKDDNNDLVIIQRENEQFGRIRLLDATSTRIDISARGDQGFKTLSVPAVFNENGGDNDFRVEADSYSNAIWVDASSGNVNFDGARTNFGGINVDTADGEINAGLVKLRNSNTTSGEFLSVDAEGTSSNQNMIFYWYDGAYRNRFLVAGNSGETVVNESGLDVDFRVESDGNANAIFVDASADKVGVLTTTLDASLNVGNDLQLNLNSTVKRKHYGKFISSRGAGDGTYFGYLLLVPYNSGPSTITGAAMQGRFVAHRGNSGAGNSPATCDVYVSAVYNNTWGWFTRNGYSNYFEKMVRVTYSGTEYLALKFAQTGGGPTNGIYFDGWSIRADANFLLMARDTEVTGETDYTIPSQEIGLTGTNYLNKGVIINEAGDDADFRVESDSATHMLFVDAGSNAVGINTSSPKNDAVMEIRDGGLASGAVLRVSADDSAPYALVVASNAHSTTTTDGLAMWMGTSNRAWIDVRGGSGQSLNFRTGGYTKASVTSNGLTFNGDTAAANALDDYEEGTWTVTTNVGTIQNNTGFYTKIGDMVYATAVVGNFSDTSSSSVIDLSLPFTSKNTSGLNNHGSCMSRYIAKSNKSLTTYVPGNAAYVQIYANGTNSDAWSALTYSDLSSGSAYLRFSVCYKV